MRRCVLRQAQDEEYRERHLENPRKNAPHPELVEGRTMSLQPSAALSLFEEGSAADNVRNALAAAAYSTTSSAMSSNFVGTSRPSALAVVTLMTSFPCCAARTRGRNQAAAPSTISNSRLSI